MLRYAPSLRPSGRAQRNPRRAIAMSALSATRDQLAWLFRMLPHFRGKARLGASIGHFLTNVSDDQGNVVTAKMKDGSLMRIDVRSRTEAWPYWTGVYDSDVISRIYSLLERDCVVLDIGANVGFYSVPIARRIQHLGGILYAFEPVCNNFNRLEESVKLNKLEHVIRVFNVALGDEEGVVEMFMEDDNKATSGNAIIHKGKIVDKFTHNATARITRLDAFAEEQGINACDFIKVDIEGSEFMFLRGGINFIKSYRPIIYGEFSRYWMKQFGHSFIDVANLIEPIGYRFFEQKYHNEDASEFKFEEVLQPKSGIQNVILAPRETPDSKLRRLGVALS